MKIPSFLIVALITSAACGAVEQEEDVAAARGKADGASVQGIFHSDGPGIQVIALHGADSSAPAGSTGFFDMSRTVDEDGYVAEHLQGTYKLYRFGGKDRIRLNDADGNELLRENWSYKDNQLALGDISLWRNSPLAEEMVSCVALNVTDPTILQESLSVFEYPNVSVDGVAGGDANVLSIGSSGFDASEMALTTTRTATDLIVSAAWTEEETLTLSVPNAVPRRGTVTYQRKGEAAVVLADVICHPKS
ncbi:MAG: hypothetical protein KBG15_10525 [Kofleriaceae bacterium]|nr:hypothetical protein [Kofleriaceae bacterium]